MKPTSEILERIEKCSSEHKDGVFTRLYRYLLREDIYYAAYQKLYANSDWETVMKKKRRKTLVVCSKCHERIHRH